MTFHIINCSKHHFFQQKGGYNTTIASLFLRNFAKKVVFQLPFCKHFDYI